MRRTLQLAAMVLVTFFSVTSVAAASTAYDAKVKLRPKPPVTLTAGGAIEGRVMVPGTRFTSIDSVCFISRSRETCSILATASSSASEREPASTTHTFGFVWDDIKTCEGETIIFTGQVSTTVHRSWTPDGAFHFALATHFVRATGVSDSGVTYRVIGGAQGQEFKIIEGEQVVREIIYSDEERLALISENGDSNWLVTIIVHATITPDGEITAEVYHSDNKCLSL